MSWLTHTHFSLLQTYVVPQASLFGNVSGNPAALFNNIRVYGTILLILLSLIVFVGVKIVSHFSMPLIYQLLFPSSPPQVNWFATVCLVAVIIAVVSIYAGAFDPRERVL